MMRTTTRRLATLKFIAEKTGYSVNTVSRALRNKEDIAQETRAKIRKVADEMGYVSNMPASSLRLGYTRTIAVILGDISNPHFAIMMKEIEEHASSHGYSSFLINTNEDEEMERKAIQDALNKSVDGIIICPVQKTEDNIRYLTKTGLPFVLIGRRYASLPADYVVCNDELGGYQATSYLIEQGHRDILMLHGPSYISSASERLEGYKRAHRALGLNVRPQLMRQIPVAGASCESILDELLQANVQFSAIFAFSDMLAWDAWACLIRKGFRVPQDYSLIGFDHIQSRLSLPFPLSTISTYKGRMSVEAVDILVDRMRNADDDGPRMQVIDTSLMIGSTVVPSAADHQASKC